MLESAEVGHKIAKPTYVREEAKLREALLDGQYEMAEAGRGPILVLFSGLEGGGRGETANKLNEWMDPRFIRTNAFGPGAPEEVARPIAWRYWRALPPRGRIGIFMNAWYRQLVNAHIRNEVTKAQFSAHLQEVRQYEQMLTDEGIVLLKFWIHLSKEGQKRRLRELASSRKTRWRVTAIDKVGQRHYNKYHDVWEEMLRETSIGAAPWYVVEGTDSNYRNLTVGRILHGAMSKVNAGAKPAPRAVRRTAAVGCRQCRLDPPARPHAEARREDVRAGPSEMAGAIGAAHTAEGVSRPFAHHGLRGLGCGGQGRSHTPRSHGARCAPLRRDRADRSSHRGGVGTALFYGVFGGTAAPWTLHDLRPHLVWPRAGGAH